MTPPITRKPRLIPVLDVRNGQVVRAVGGRRHEYRPIQSQLTQSTELKTVAEALLAASNTTELYVADLDAIGGEPSVGREVREFLESTTVPVWLDAGFGSRKGLDLPDLGMGQQPLRMGNTRSGWPGQRLCDAQVSSSEKQENPGASQSLCPGHPIPQSPSVEPRHDLPLIRPVIGFETCRTPDYLRDSLIPSRLQTVAFSIDLRDGTLVGNWRTWGLESDRDAIGLVRKVIGVGCSHVIVLDLARVGTGSGCGTEDLLRSIRGDFPEVDLIAGGGVRTWGDVERLGELGVDAVLVASALHDQTITSRPAS